MTTELTSKTVAFLMANSGVEQDELTSPWEAVTAAGGTAKLVAPEAGTVQGFRNDVEKADTFDVDLTLAQADAADFDALVLPGGTTNADALRLEESAVAYVKAFVEAGKPVAAICHGPWALVEADVLHGKTLTSYPSLKTDIRNAGGQWKDEEVFVCTANEWTLVTSRKPDDLPAFDKAIVKAISGS